MTHAPALGYDPLIRSWVTVPDACTVFAPALDGELTTAPDALTEAGRDLGRATYRRPGAVLRPGSAGDIARMVCLCRDYGIPVAAQGAGHTTDGQRLVGGGLAIDMSALNAIHAVGPDWVDVDAGMLWSDLVPVLAGRGMQFRGGLTGYLGLTVGGTLSVGGISTLHQQGAQIDAVQALQVVTGHGDIVWCSDTDNADLFSAALGGLGQVGIITRARLELVPAPPWVGTCVVPYRDADAAFEAMRTAVECGRAHEVFCVILPPCDEAPPTFQVHLAYHQPDSSPQHDDLLAGLPDWTGPAVTNVVRFLEHVRTYDAVIDLWRGGDWDDRLKPWFDVWLGDDPITQFVTQTVSEMTMEDWSLPDGGGFVLLFPHRAETFGRPRLRLPQDHGVVWLFDVLNVAAPKPDPGYRGRMLARNHRWMTRAESVGGVRYPIGTLHYTSDDWSRHYGSTWDDVVRHKRLYDPAGILTPGPRMFR